MYSIYMLDESSEPLRPGAPTPATVARALLHRKGSQSPNSGNLEKLLESVEQRFPQTKALIQKFGLDFLEEIFRWVSDSGLEHVSAFLELNLDPWRFAAATRSATEVPLIECLIFEELMFNKLDTLGPYLELSRVVENYYYLTAKALYKRLGGNKQDIPEYETRKIASVCTSAFDRFLANRSNPSKTLVAERAVSVLAQIRFGDGDFERLKLTLEELETLTEVDGLAWTISYFVEGISALFEFENNPLNLARKLQRVVNHYEQSGSRFAIADMNICEAYLRLAGLSRMDTRSQWLEKANSWLERNWSQKDEDSKLLRLRERMLSVAIKRLKTPDGLNLPNFNGISMPFAYRTSRDSDRPVLDFVGPDLFDLLKDSREYVERDVATSIASFLASDPQRQDRISYLRLARSIRSGERTNSNKLQGTRYEIDDARDLASLADLTGEEKTRHHAIRAWIDQFEEPRNRLEAMSSLAWEIQNNGKAENIGWLPRAAIRDAITNGDAASLFRMAAAAALEPKSHRIEGLGGQGAAKLVYMSRNGLANQLVYKSTRRAVMESAEARAKLINEHINQNELVSKFAIPSTLTILQNPEDADSAISVRTYEPAPTLAKLAIRDDPKLETHLENVVEFLALIHAVESNGDDQRGPRRIYREDGLLRWLKRLTDDEVANALFNEWWGFVENAPVFTKRDAHGLNWLVKPSGKIIAIDLDSKKPTIFGDELAQLLLDPVTFSLDSLDFANQMLELYLKKLKQFGWEGDLPIIEAKSLFLAGVANRAVQYLTDPKSTEKMQIGLKIIELLISQNVEPLEGWLNKVKSIWQIKHGALLFEGNRKIHRADKVRISQTISYHLRHNEDAPVDSHGWMHIDDLQDLLAESNLKVTAQDIKALTGVQGENRFELAQNGYEIRALYGHSREVKLNLINADMPEFLYHATSVKNLTSIIRAKDGLKRGQRLHVHLSTNAKRAYQSALRFGEPVVVFAISSKNLPSSALQASHKSETWLIDQVPFENLQILPISGFHDEVIVEPYSGDGSDSS